ncbi:MAG: DUF192 domain-containing protein [Deltaproteobacteria bacterium]|nr:DUF192 domain-containing protein [Deltaproteobacteria bacterium]
MKNKLISFGILAAVVIAAGFGVNQIKSSSKTTLSAETVPATEFSLDQYARSGVRIGEKTFSVELALTDEQQALGLGERDTLAINAGMLFVFKPAQTPAFWMKDMRFDLDIIWIFDGRVVDISRRVPAPKSDAKPENLPTYSPDTEVDYVLEINASAADGITIGDRVEVVNSSQV